MLKSAKNLLSRRSARVAGQAVVITALIGGTAAYAAADTTVELTVDGETEEVRAFGNTVADILDAAEVEVGARDVVAPSLESKVDDGSEVVVRHARQLTVTVDGETETYWTTALTVGDALRDVDVRATGVRVSASRSLELGREGLAVDVTTPKNVEIHVDGEVVPSLTLQPTVGHVLTEAGVKVDGDDKLSVPADAPVSEGLAIGVTRIAKEAVVQKKAIPFETERRRTGDLYEDQSRVAQAGKNGERTITFEDVTADGERISRTKVADEVTAKPVNKVVLVGTKDRPAAAPARASRSASRGSSSAAAPSRSTASGSVWDRLAQCESGGNWSINTGNGYYGGLQFSASSWRAVGGSGLPHQASRATQIQMAERLKARQGWGAWPACTSKLGLR